MILLYVRLLNTASANYPIPEIIRLQVYSSIEIARHYAEKSDWWDTAHKWKANHMETNTISGVSFSIEVYAIDDIIDKPIMKANSGKYDLKEMCW